MASASGLKPFLEGTAGKEAALGSCFQSGETRAGAPPTGGWAKFIIQGKKRHRKIQARSHGQGHTGEVGEGIWQKGKVRL